MREEVRDGKRDGGSRCEGGSIIMSTALMT